MTSVRLAVELAAASSGAVATELEHALLEERQEVADVVLGQTGGVFIGPERRAGGRQHHLEQVPQVALKEPNHSHESDGSRHCDVG